MARPTDRHRQRDVSMGIFEGIFLVIVSTGVCEGLPTFGLLILFNFDGGLFPLCIFFLSYY